MNNKNRKKIRIRKRTKELNKNLYPRIVVFRSNKNFYAQLVCLKTGKIVACSSTKSKSFLEKVENKKIRSIQKAEIVGKLFAKTCLEKGVKSVVFDRGHYIYSGRVKSFAESCRSEGLSF